MKFSNEYHPELKPGEVFLRNDGETGFSRVVAVFPSARQGRTAYNIHGDKLSDAEVRPIFVNQEQLNAAGGALMVEVRYAELSER